MIEIFRKLFSRALLLTYFFIGYLAIANHVTPESRVDDAAAFHADQTTVPGSAVFRVFTAKHIRPDNQAPIVVLERPSEPSLCPDVQNFSIITYESPVLIFIGFSSLHSSRAPPLA